MNYINNVINSFKKGDTILYPADTIWGLGCDATNEAAINRIYKLKKRNKKGMLILVHDESLILKHVKDVPDVAWDLLEHAEPAVTIIYPQALNLPNILLPDNGSVAIRLVKSGFIFDVLKRLNRPIVSTSANISNLPFDGYFNNIHPDILNGVDCIVNSEYAKDLTYKPSSIIKLDIDGSFKIIRK